MTCQKDLYEQSHEKADFYTEDHAFDRLFAFESSNEAESKRGITKNKWCHSQNLASACPPKRSVGGESRSELETCPWRMHSMFWIPRLRPSDFGGQASQDVRG